MNAPTSAVNRRDNAAMGPNGSKRGRIRRISIVALARKLLIALARYLSHGEIPAGAVITAG